MNSPRTVGRYEILRELGRGGMARVHLARQLDLDRFAALKELGAFHVEDRTMLERFLRESRVAGSLNHPNLVTVFDFFAVEGVPYIGMEYVPGGALRPHVGKLSLAQIGGVLEGVLSGLAHAHAAGVVHRDLKPENLMVSAEGRIKIADFGIAKAVNDAGGTAAFATATGAMIGTPSYMAPEQALAEPPGPFTDLYATGVIAYELLCGQVPFVGGEPMSVLLRAVNENPRVIGDRVQLPPGLSDWVMALLAKAPRDRPASATVAWESLEEILIDALGPRWRRAAPLGTSAQDAPEVAKPLTPSPFPSEPGVGDSAAWGAPDTPLPSAPPDAAARLHERGQSPTVQPPGPPAADAPPPPPPPQAPAPAQPARGKRRGLAIGGGILAGILVAVLVIVLVSRGGSNDEQDAPKPAASPAVTAVSSIFNPQPLSDQWMRGIHLDAYGTDAVSTPGALKAIAEAKTDGADVVVLHVYVKADKRTTSELHVDTDSTPSLASLGKAIDAAEQQGMSAVIAPQVVLDTGYSGDLRPDDAGAFVGSYAKQIAPYVTLSAQRNLPLFIFASQFPPAVRDANAMRQLITQIKSDYGGTVTYGADGIDDAEDVPFWDQLDVIGLIQYGGQSQTPTSDPRAILRGWGPISARLQRLHDKFGKPAMIAQTGFANTSNGVNEPFDKGGDVDDAVQTAAYNATFAAFRGKDWFTGILWDQLQTEAKNTDAKGLDFGGKPGEQTLKAWQTAR